jgi:hypothetical protein
MREVKDDNHFTGIGQMVKIARVFPRVTNATPKDDYTFFDAPGMFLPEIDEVHVSVAFTYDLPKAEWLAKQWEAVGVPVKIGGPALGKHHKLGEFTPGLYLKPGYVITSRGCPNAETGKCWFCSEPKGPVELKIKEGNNILDPNLLACSDQHILKVFAMLKKQKYGRAIFTGGLEAARLKDWHIDLLVDIKPTEMFFAYDTPDDLEPLIVAGSRLFNAGFTKASHTLRAYCLIGYPGDTFELAEQRIGQVMDAGFMPMAMLFRNKKGVITKEWSRFQRLWANPYIVGAKLDKEGE